MFFAVNVQNGCSKKGEKGQAGFKYILSIGIKYYNGTDGAVQARKDVKYCNVVD